MKIFYNLHPFDEVASLWTRVWNNKKKLFWAPEHMEALENLQEYLKTADTLFVKHSLGHVQVLNYLILRQIKNPNSLI